MMKSSRIKVYAYFDKASNAFTVSGIEFREFIQYLTVPLDNLLLVKGDYFGNRVSNHFELLEGRESIAQLAREEIYTWGDFCFFDYSTNGNPDNLTKQEIAEILYFSHTQEAMRPPFLQRFTTDSRTTRTMMVGNARSIAVHRRNLRLFCTPSYSVYALRRRIHQVSARCWSSVNMESCAIYRRAEQPKCRSRQLGDIRIWMRF